VDVVASGALGGSCSSQRPVGRGESSMSFKKAAPLFRGDCDIGGHLLIYIVVVLGLVAIAKPLVGSGAWMVLQLLCR